MKVNNISELIGVALSPTGNVHAQLAIGKLPAYQAKYIKDYINENLTGCERIIDTSGIRHTIKTHGSQAKEAKHGQEAITIDDFYKIPLILKEPDEIIYGGKNKLKQDVFIYYKKIKNEYVVAECVRFSKHGNKLVFATMYKKKVKTR